MEINSTTMLALVVVGVLVVLGLISAVVSRMQRTKRLQERFGPEYDRTVNEIGDRRQAETELETRLEHVKELDIRPLSAEEMDRFTAAWQATQAEFVDEPLVAIRKADQLLSEVMKARGYPVTDFEQGVADISVDFPDLIVDYRGLHLIATRGDAEDVSTEEMRKAMVHAKALFENLVRNVRAAEPHENEKERI